MIDWNVARITAARLARPGPEVSRGEAETAVAHLRAAAKHAEGPVRDFTGLAADSDTAPVFVIDRVRWTEANVASFSTLLDPLVTTLTREKPIGTGTSFLAGTVAGAEIGALTAYLSSKVLGQFDPFGGGRLLLVAPNIVAAEQRLGVDPQDFRQWVCLHEETHRVQFTAVPWLADHLRGLISQFAESADLSVERIAQSFGEALKIARGESAGSIADAIQTPQQRAIVDQVTGVMSLLEGHADVVMDGVGPAVVPSVVQIRAKFEQRRDSASSLDKIIRRLLGLEAKLRQYREGAAFVRGVVDQIGMPGFNAVWAAPEQLPSKAEIADPAAWVRRVHG